MNVTIVGWGDTPTRPEYEVCNDQVLERIRENLRRRQALCQATEADCQELAKLESRTGQDITDKLGIVSRQYAIDQTSLTLAVEASRQAVSRAKQEDPNFSLEKIGHIASGGSTPDDLYPACAAKLQHQLDIPSVEGCDYSLACCSGTQALIGAYRALLVEPIDYALVAVGETIGSRANALLNEDGVIWGDGGGAVVLRYNSSGDSDYGIVAVQSRLDGSLARTTRSQGLGTDPIHRTFDCLNASMEGCGREIYRWVTQTVASKFQSFVSDNCLKVNERTFGLFHNGNLKMILPVGEKVGIPPERVLHRITNRANQSSASVFSSLAYFAERGTFQRGDLLLLATFGGGLAYNFLAYRWP